ncbi:MAG: beta-ketoacyl synthase N-terminal-like domain-containing protein, partial [Blastocatellia bacterium]
MHDGPLESSAAKFADLIRRNGVTVLHLPPAFWQPMAEDLSTAGLTVPGCVKLLLTGGESSVIGNLALLARILERPMRLINAYGPTEATITSTTHETLLDREWKFNRDRLPIGKPIDNVQTYLLDGMLNPAPIGVWTELWVSGAGITRGYVGRPDTTAESFRPNPFGVNAAPVMYRTGDIARCLPDGNIECRGRIDHQVKIRGFRIELGEIESVLAGHNSVRQCAVLLRADVPEHKSLVAYVVQSNEVSVAGDDLKRSLRERLPEYMVPSSFVLLESLPLTSGGKIDRRKLPKPDDYDSPPDKSLVRPTTELERTIARVWCDLLGVDQVGLKSNFFDLGGHSLLAIKACGKLSDQLGTEVTVMEMFQYPTVASLAERLGSLNGMDSRHARIEPLVPRPEGMLVGDGRSIESNDIAIVGLSGRFPGAPTVEAFWRNLEAGVESISFFSEQELKAAGVDPVLLSDSRYVGAGAVIEDIDRFDAPFFGFSATEAEILDPQHRLFLE